MVRSYPFWRDYLRRQEPDVIQLDAKTLAPLLHACRPSGSRVLCVVQETAVRGWLGLRSASFRSLLSKMDGVMFISDYDRQKARCRAPIVEVIPNWVEIGPTPEPADVIEARRKLGLPEDAKVVLMMGGISHLKGTLTLVEAAAHLHDMDRLVVCIAGYEETPQAPRPAVRAALGRFRRPTTSDRHQVFDAMERHGLKQRVRFLGMRADVLPLYVAADVVVFPATGPHQARPVLEAGSAGKPVVVSDFPNIAEFVVHDVNGLTFAPGDSAALAVQLRRVLGDRDLAQRLGHHNREMTLARHDARVNGRRYASLLERLAARKTAKD
jgi:glycosyltransferase involved in cell wall biosynthesis